MYLPHDIVRYILGFLDEVPIDTRLEFGISPKPIRLSSLRYEKPLIHSEYDGSTYLTVGSYIGYWFMILSDRCTVTTWSSETQCYRVFYMEESGFVHMTDEFRYYVPCYVFTSPSAKRRR
jgi:hypothetical protein